MLDLEKTDTRGLSIGPPVVFVNQTAAKHRCGYYLGNSGRLHRSISYSDCEQSTFMFRDSIPCKEHRNRLNYC